MPKESFGVGDRVRSGDHTATVRFVGAVEGTKGEWYGVEWDDESRGKHNGTYKEQQYFQTKGDKNSGSFIRKKLTWPAHTGTEAVREKYGTPEDDVTLGIDEDEAYIVNPDSGHVTNIEIVGMKSINALQSDFTKLEIVNLANMDIYGEVDGELLGVLIPNCQELDLSMNLVPSWEVVADMVSHLKKLHTLSLRGNRLMLDENRIRTMRESFSSLRMLNLAAMAMDWGQVADSSDLWPQIKELHICWNNITQLTPMPTDNFQCVKVLNLDGNPINSWSNITTLANLPRLEELLLNSCQLTDISLGDGDFPKLRYISLCENKLDQWCHINQLLKAESLRELQLWNNPLLEKEHTETNRQLIIAKIPQLKVHNRTKIEVQERKGAEIDYLKRFGLAWLECGGCEEKNEKNIGFYSDHPVYSQLVKKWGAPESSEVTKEQKSALTHSLISINFVNTATDRKISKKIPASMVIMKVKLLGMKLLGLRGIDATISYRAAKNQAEYAFDNELRELSFYAVSEGDDIFICPS